MRNSALVYCRVSSTKQEEKGTSLESQAAECVKYAEAEGYQVAEVVKETFSGAYLFDRPKLNEQREKIRQGLYDAVVVYDVDRLSRKMTHLAIIADEIERYGAKLLFVNNDFFVNTLEGQLLLSVKSYAAEVEREKIKERTVRGKKTKVLSGKLVKASTNLYGYDFDDENKVRITNRGEAVIVQRIFEMFLNDGEGIRGIYKQLNEEEIPSPGTGKRNFKSAKYTNLARHGKTLWNKGAIYRILTEPAYSGHTIAWRYEGVGGYEKGERFYRIKKRDESEWIEMPDGTTPAIVTPEMFKSVKAKLAVSHGEARRNETRPELLRGLVFCGDCGMKMYPEKEKSLIVFRCSSRNTIRCGGRRINGEKCEAAVWEQICKIIRNPQMVRTELERKNAEGDNERLKIETEILHASEKVKSLETEISLIYRRSASADDEKWKRFEKVIENKEKELKAAQEVLAEAKKRLEGSSINTEALRALIDYSVRTAVNLKKFGFSEKRLTLEAFNVKISGNGKDIRLDVLLPIFENQQVNGTNDVTYRSAGFGKNDAGKMFANDFAAARI